MWIPIGNPRWRIIICKKTTRKPDVWDTPALSSFRVRTITSLSRTSPHSLEALVRNANRVYNIPACRSAHFHKGIKSGANSRNRKPLEAVPRGESGSPGAARGQFQGATRRIRDSDGTLRLWQVVAAVRNRWAGAVFSRARPGGRQRPGGYERRRAHQASAAQDRLRVPEVQPAADTRRAGQHRHR